VKYTVPEVDEVTTKGRLTGRKIRADLTHPEDTVELEVPALEQYVFDELEIKNAYSDVATKITEKTAGVVVETIQGAAGFITPENDYLKKLKKQSFKLSQAA